MTIRIEHIEIPKKLEKYLGKPADQTRMWETQGDTEAYRAWFHAVREVCGSRRTGRDSGCVSPGGASMYLRLSRAAVHMRIDAGKLTAFYFYPEQKGLFGRPKVNKNNAYILIPMREIVQWVENREKGAEDE